MDLGAATQSLRKGDTTNQAEGDDSNESSSAELQCYSCRIKSKEPDPVALGKLKREGVPCSNSRVPKVPWGKVSTRTVHGKKRTMRCGEWCHNCALVVRGWARITTSWSC